MPAANLVAEIEGTLLYEGAEAHGPGGKVYVRAVADGPW